MKKNCLRILLFSLLMSIFAAGPVLAEDSLTKEDKYGISDCWYDQDEDGRIYVCWEKSSYSTSYCYRLKCGEKYVTKLRTGNSTKVDVTDVVVATGKGTYYVEVYPQKGGPSMKISSVNRNPFKVDSAVYSAASKAMKAQEKQTVELTKTVKNIDLKISEQRADAGVVRPVSITDGVYYKVQSVSFSKPYETWKPGDRIYISVTIVPADGYSFSDALKVKCKSAESVSLSGSGDTRVVSLLYVPYASLNIPHLLFVDENNVLYWESVDHAQEYVFTFKMDGAKVSQQTVKRIKLDLSPFVADARLLSIDVNSSAGTNSYIYVDSSKKVIESLEQFLKEYQVHGSVEKGSGSLHYTPDDGQSAAGWKKLGQDWYYFNQSGSAKKQGWFQDTDGSWYYFNFYNRALSSQWFQDADGSWYYFGADCRMMKNCTTPDGYVVGADGRWIP